jgi:hypothetical protein
MPWIRQKTHGGMSKGAAYPPSMSGVRDRGIQPIGTNIAAETHRFWEALAVVGGLGLILHAALSLIFVNQECIFRAFSCLELAAGLGTVAIDAWFLTHICLPNCIQKDIDTAQAYDSYKGAAHPPSMSGVPDQRIQPIRTNVAMETHLFWETLGVVGGLGLILHAVLSLIFVNQEFIFRVFSCLELTIGLTTVTIDAWFLTHICLPSCIQKDIDAAQAYDSFAEEPILSPTKIDE